MQLTGKQILDRGIVGNTCPEALQQQGIDVRVEEIYDLDNCPGVIPAQGSTTIPKTSQIQPAEGGWWLAPGYYEVKLMESVNVPNNAALTFKTRSSLVRSGAIVHSGQFDAGFHTNNAGCFLEVLRHIKIEQGARIAQAIVHETEPVTNTYDGQWQADKQRQ